MISQNRLSITIIIIFLSSYLNKKVSGFLNYTFQNSETDLNVDGNFIATLSIPNHKAILGLNLFSTTSLKVTVNHIAKRSRGFKSVYRELQIIYLGDL